MEYLDFQFTLPSRIINDVNKELNDCANLTELKNFTDEKFNNINERLNKINERLNRKDIDDGTNLSGLKNMLAELIQQFQYQGHNLRARPHEQRLLVDGRERRL